MLHNKLCFKDIWYVTATSYRSDICARFLIADRSFVPIGVIYYIISQPGNQWLGTARWQANVGTNVGPVQWRLYMSLGINDLTWTGFQYEEDDKNNELIKQMLQCNTNCDVSRPSGAQMQQIQFIISR